MCVVCVWQQYSVGRIVTALSLSLDYSTMLELYDMFHGRVVHIRRATTTCFMRDTYLVGRVAGGSDAVK